VLGLLALYAPIARTYNHDFVTAWYEVALVPKPVVAGHGVKELLGLPSLGVLSAFVVLLGVGFLTGYAHRRFGERIGRIVARLVILLSTCAFLVYVYLILKRHDFDVADTFLPNKLSLLLFVPTIIIYLLVAFVSLRLLQGGMDFPRGAALPRVTNLKYLVVAVLLLFADLFFLGVVTAAYKDPPLPSVEIHGSKKVEGALLAHTDRFWYVIDEDGQLVGTPDTHVTSVHVLPKSD
jgi:hypothetical protein